MSSSVRPRVWRVGDGPVSLWAVPNLITFARILFVPLMAWMLLAAGSQGVPPTAPLDARRWAALALFVVAITSDALDGYLARSRGLVSNLGKLLDPIADKALTGTALVCLSILGELPWWVTAVILARELGITVWRLIEARRRVLPAGRGGKLKTLTQAVAIAFAIAPLPALLGDWMHWANTTLMALALALTVASGADYLVRAYWGSSASKGARTQGVNQ